MDGVARLGSYDWSDFLTKALNRFCDFAERKSADVNLCQKTIMVKEFILLHNLVDHLLCRADHQGSAWSGHALELRRGEFQRPLAPRRPLPQILLVERPMELPCLSCVVADVGVTVDTHLQIRKRVSGTLTGGNGSVNTPRPTIS
jgi:hypothetical protein